MNIKKRTAFVSGASRGIGEAIARRLYAEGYELILTCEKSADRLEALADELRGSVARTTQDKELRKIAAQKMPGNKLHEDPQRILTLIGDIADFSFVKSLADEALKTFGAVDVVINNAGISKLGLLTDLSVDEWERVLSVNLSSCFYTAKAFVPAMVRKQSGAIINISSIWGQTGASCEVAYSASKGGMDAFTKALAKELAPSHITVNAISCGVIDTEMNAFLSDEERSVLMDEIPAGRFGAPDEVASAVLSVLTSGEYLTGQIIGLNGGW